MNHLRPGERENLLHITSLVRSFVQHTGGGNCFRAVYYTGEIREGGEKLCQVTAKIVGGGIREQLHHQYADLCFVNVRQTVRGAGCCIFPRD